MLNYKKEQEKQVFGIYLRDYAVKPTDEPIKQNNFKIFSGNGKSPENSHCEKSKLRFLYEAVYKNFISENQYLDDLSYEKPDFDILEKFDGSCISSYNFAKNKILFAPFYKEDVFAYFTKTKTDDYYVFLSFGFEHNKKETEFELKNLIKLNKIIDYKVAKLTPQEKHKYLESFLAHELRRSLQEHLIASTSEGNRLIQDCINWQIYNDISVLKTVLNFSDINNVLLEKVKSAYAYGLNYSPKKLLSKNDLLRCPSILNKEMYWTIGQLFQCYKEQSYKKSNLNNIPNILEIDAVAYQAEYIGKFIFPNYEMNFRKEMYDAMLFNCYLNSVIKISSENISLISL